MKVFLLLLSLLFASSTFAKLPYCDNTAKKAAIKAHQKKFPIALDTGCSVESIKYKGLKKIEVIKDGNTLLETTTIKQYEILIVDEVDGNNWLIEVDAAKNCKITKITSLGYF